MLLVDMNRVRVGVIGLGRFGEVHCEALSGLETVQLTALSTRTHDRLDAVGARFGVTKLYSDYRDMLADPEVDAVSVVTMWDQHAAPVLDALAAGKHVFVEKPMASTTYDCQAMLNAAEASNRVFMVGHICRFNPRFASAKREIESGAIGKVVSMYARRNIPASVSETVLQKIGPIVGDGVHDTDLMLWFTGARIVSAYAQTHSERHLRHPDLGWTMYRFDTGAVGVLENVWFLPENTPYRIDERMEIVGTEGAIYIQDSPAAISVCDKSGWRSPDATYWPMLYGHRAGALRDELAYFVRCIIEGRKPTVVSPRDAMHAVEACLAAEESAATGAPIRLT